MRNIGKVSVMTAFIIMVSWHTATSLPLNRAGIQTSDLSLRAEFQNRGTSRPTITSGSATTVSLVGNSLWARLTDVAVAGNYAYCAMNEGLMVMDISTPSNPVVVKYLLLNGRADAINSGYSWDGGIVVSGNYVYLSGGTNGLYIIDISTPSLATLVGHCSTRKVARDVAITGNYACVADADSGLQIIDVSSPSSPTLVGTYRGGYAYAVAASGNYAYLAQWYSGVKIIDISSPASPTAVGSYTGVAASGLAVSGSYLYVAGAGGGVSILDVSNPATPLPTGIIPVSSWDVAITGHYACVARGGDGPSVNIVDVIDPASPVIVGGYDVVYKWSGVYKIAAFGNSVFALENEGGLYILNITTPASPSLTKWYRTTNAVNNVSTSGNYAYVSTGIMGLSIVDVTNPAAPIVMGQYSNVAYDAVVSGNYAYVANYWGLEVVSISNPSSPLKLSNYTGGTGSGMRVAMSGNYVYYRGQILNVSNPWATPVVTGSHAFGLVTAVSGTHAYACAGSSGLNILDVSNPASPTLAGNYNTPGSALDVVISGNLAYIADSTSLQIINISNPSSPIFVGSFATTSIVSRVAVAGSLAYMTGGVFGYQIIDKGLEIIDVTNPASPTLATTFDSPSIARATAVSGNNVFLADYDGLLILNVTRPCCTAATTGDVDASGSVDISDLTAMSDYLFNSLLFPNDCFLEQDADKSGAIDISDLQAIIDFLFNGMALPSCP